MAPEDGGPPVDQSEAALTDSERSSVRVDAASWERAWLPVVFVVFAVLRVLAVIGLPPGRFGDTPTYFQLSFLGRAPRLWTVPLLYNLVQSDFERAVWQVVIGIGCWWYAARSLAAELTDARTRAAAIVNVYGIGLTINIASWDLTILSDSLAVSLTVLLMALWWRELHHPGRWTAVALVVASILWVFTRHSNVLVNHLIVIAAAASIVSARPRWRRAAVVAALVATSCWGQYALTRNHYDSRVNINALIIERIEPTPSYLRWWIDHGLPRVPQRYAEVEPTSRLYEPGYVAWLDRHGESTYALSLITHPAYTLASPWTDLLPFSSGQLEQPSTTPTMLGLAEHYGKARDASRR